ncbi:MAG: hypothetical protein SOV61_11905 [Lachnospiraceae bacterium]|nr:hypothetical protein [Lachnospiraceae bacterium]MDY3275695.1 hypothetical protein [Agathobacter sp.]
MTDRELLEDMYGKMQSMEDKIRGMNDKLELTNQKVTAMQLSLENETNHNIQLLAENHINLVDKLNQAIHAQDKSLLYEVQVSGLKARVEQLERDVKDINSRIA